MAIRVTPGQPKNWGRAMAVSKSLRYQILRRDNHTCRYCGRSAPEVKLTVDHVQPEALGGVTDPSNLVAACSDCNSGKSATPPDAALIAGVSADALRWARAIQASSASMLADLRRREQDRANFLEAWNGWGFGTGKKRQTVPLPADWAPTIDRFVSLGIPLAILVDSITTAMTAKNVSMEKTFNYWCGIAWNKIRQLQEAASADVSEEDGDESFEPHPRCRDAARDEALDAFFLGRFELLPELFNEAREFAAAEMELDPEDRTYTDEKNGVVDLTAHFFLDNLIGCMTAYDRDIRKFLDRAPAALVEVARQEATADYFKAGMPYVDESELAPHILRHLGRIIADKGSF